MQDLESSNAGRAVRAARERAGLSQQVLATRANLAVRTLARIEGGEDMRLGTLDAIASALGTTTATLLSAPSGDPAPAGDAA